MTFEQVMQVVQLACTLGAVGLLVTLGRKLERYDLSAARAEQIPAIDRRVAILEDRAGIRAAPTAAPVPSL